MWFGTIATDELIDKEFVSTFLRSYLTFVSV